MGGVGWVVAHKILVTSPEAKFLFPFLGPFGAWALDWDLASGLSINLMMCLCCKQVNDLVF